MRNAAIAMVVGLGLLLGGCAKRCAEPCGPVCGEPCKVMKKEYVCK